MTNTAHDSETPAIGQQVITACAFIHESRGGIEYVFLARRSETKKFMPGIYELPGGHIDYGEDIVAGLKREIQEELGAKADIGEPFAAFTYMNGVKGSHSVEVIYFAQLTTPISEDKPDPEDHSGFFWFCEADLPTTAANKGAQDPEMLAIKRGFEILRNGH